MIDGLRRKLGGFLRLSDHTAQMLGSLLDDPVDFAPGEMIVGQGADYGAIYLLENGWVFRSKILPSGARQIVSIALSGDFVALNALLFHTSDFDHLCKSPVTAYRISPARLAGCLAQAPSLSSALFWMTTQEESILAERIVSLGRRNALSRTAHVLCEFIARLDILDAGEMPTIAIPMSQEDFSDVLGISAVHMNKCLKALERAGIVSFRNGLLLVRDRAKLERQAGFDSGYLHFTRRSDVRELIGV